MFNHVEVAKSIRHYLKARGISAKVNSNQKGGCPTVKVTVYDVSPKTYLELEIYLNHYRYQEHASLPIDDTLASELPKVEYLFMVNHFTETVRQRALNYIAAKTNTPAIDYSNINFQATFKVYDDMHDTIGNILMKVLNGSNCYTFHFWDEA